MSLEWQPQLISHHAERIVGTITPRGCLCSAQSSRDILLWTSVLGPRRTDGKRNRAPHGIDSINHKTLPQHWLDANTRLSRQLKDSKDVFELYFSVKFYAVDPCKLFEEITRYNFYLQLKQDVLQGRLPVTFDLASQLGAYVVQCE